jgi:hypothetical protein
VEATGELDPVQVKSDQVCNKSGGNPTDVVAS